MLSKNTLEDNNNKNKSEFLLPGKLLLTFNSLLNNKPDSSSGPINVLYLGASPGNLLDIQRKRPVERLCLVTTNRAHYKRLVLDIKDFEISKSKESSCFLVRNLFSFKYTLKFNLIILNLFFELKMIKNHHIEKIINTFSFPGANIIIVACPEKYGCEEDPTDMEKYIIENTGSILWHQYRALGWLHCRFFSFPV